MKKDIFDDMYFRERARMEKYFYTQLLCEIIMLRFLNVYDNITKKDVLSELPCLRNFKVPDVESIYKNAITLLSLKHNVEVISDNPFVFKDNRI